MSEGTAPWCFDCERAHKDPCRNEPRPGEVDNRTWHERVDSVRESFLETGKVKLAQPDDGGAREREPWKSDNGRQAYEVGLDLAALDDPTGVIADAIDLLATWQPDDAPTSPPSEASTAEEDEAMHQRWRHHPKRVEVLDEIADAARDSFRGDPAVETTLALALGTLDLIDADSERSLEEFAPSEVGTQKFQSEHFTLEYMAGICRDLACGEKVQIKGKLERAKFEQHAERLCNVADARVPPSEVSGERGRIVTRLKEIAGTAADISDDEREALDQAVDLLAPTDTETAEAVGFALEHPDGGFMKYNDEIVVFDSRERAEKQTNHCTIVPLYLAPPKPSKGAREAARRARTSTR